MESTKIGEVLILENRKYVITGVDEKGNYILKTPYEIRREQNVKVRIGDEYTFDGETHYVSEIKNGEVVFKTGKELYEESACKGCRFFDKNTGWLKHERPKVHEKMPVCFGCKMGQFIITHKVFELPKECKLKNYKYTPREDFKKSVREMISKVGLKEGSVSRIMVPISPVLGVGIYNVPKREFSIMHEFSEKEI